MLSGCWGNRGLNFMQFVVKCCHQGSVERRLLLLIINSTGLIVRHAKATRVTSPAAFGRKKKKKTHHTPSYDVCVISTTKPTEIAQGDSKEGGLGEACHSGIVSVYTILHVSRDTTRIILTRLQCARTSHASPGETGERQRARRSLPRQNSPVVILEDELPQFEVAEDQSVVVAMRHGRGYLIEESGSFVLPQLLAGADEGVHVAIAALKEHVGSGLPEQDLQDLVDVLVLAEGKVGRQRLLVSANFKDLQTEHREAYRFKVSHVRDKLKLSFNLHIYCFL